MTSKNSLQTTSSKPFGRPTKYKPEFCELVIDMGKEGCSLTEMAAACGVLLETMNDWAKNYDDFSGALKEAKLHYQAFWEKLGREGTQGKIPNFNATGFIFNMKNRFPKDWREKTEVEQTTKNSIDLSQWSLEELNQLREHLRFINAKQIEG